MSKVPNNSSQSYTTHLSMIVAYLEPSKMLKWFFHLTGGQLLSR